MAFSSLISSDFDLSFLSTEYDEPFSPHMANTTKESEGGKAKKARNRKHHACEPCRQRKVKCDRQSNCASCRLHHKRCYYVGAEPIAVSAEDELVAAREEIERLRKLVRMLMQGKKGEEVNLGDNSITTSSSLPTPPASHYSPKIVTKTPFASPSPLPTASSPSTPTTFLNLAPSLTDEFAFSSPAPPVASSPPSPRFLGLSLPLPLPASSLSTLPRLPTHILPYSRPLQLQPQPMFDSTLFLPAVGASGVMGQGGEGRKHEG
ncbi:hypothetical protein JCM11641_004107 [Rhodosporidiobolus odoratus]